MSHHDTINQVHFKEIDDDADGQRLDNYLFRHYKSIPKSRIYKAIRKGEVRINKKRAKSKTRLVVGDIIRIPPFRMISTENKTKPSESLIQLCSQRILYEDDDLLILNKPAKIPVHAGSGVDVGVIEAMRCANSDYKNLALVHRLDKGTSGCLMLAKNRKSLLKCHELLRTKQVNKTYCALLSGQIYWSEKTVDLPLKRDRLKSDERVVCVSEDGKPAQTLFTSLRQYDQATLVEAMPITGRTHQIRVHAASIGHAVAGDLKYGDKGFNRTIRGLGLNRLFLHAKKINLPWYEKGKNLEVTAVLDEDLNKLLQEI